MRSFLNFVLALIILALYLLIGASLLFIPNLNSLSIVLSILLLFYVVWEMFSLKRELPGIYGALEVILGLILATISIIKNPENIAQYFAIYVSIYVIIRGLSNVVLCKTASEKDFLIKIISITGPMTRLFKRVNIKVNKIS